MSSSASESNSTDLQSKADARAARFGSPAAKLTPAQAGFMQGGMRKALGLELEDLRFGLRVAADQMRRGDLDEAMRSYAALVLFEPLNAEFQQGFANCALEMGQNELAARASAVAIGADPSNHKAHYISARAHLGMKQREHALADLRESLTLAETAKDAAFVQQAAALLKKVTAMQTAASA